MKHLMADKVLKKTNTGEEEEEAIQKKFFENLTKKLEVKGPEGKKLLTVWENLSVTTKHFIEGVETAEGGSSSSSSLSNIGASGTLAVTSLTGKRALTQSSDISLELKKSKIFCEACKKEVGSNFFNKYITEDVEHLQNIQKLFGGPIEQKKDSSS